MKAAVVCANEDVQYLDYEEPTPGPGEVKVKVKCSGICGSDIPRVLHNGVRFYPIVLGHEFSGDVVEVGEGVTKVKVGDHVSGAPLKPCMKCYRWIIKCLEYLSKIILILYTNMQSIIPVNQ